MALKLQGGFFLFFILYNADCMHKNTKLIITIFILISVSVLFFISDNDFVEKEQTTINDVWSHYHDEKYGYEISHPANLKVTEKNSRTNSTENNLALSGGINIADDYGFGIIDISVFENTGFSSVDDWLVKEKEKFASHRPVIENKLLISGEYEAIITHEQSDNEEVANTREKTTVFIKDNMLFRVNTRFVDESDHVKVLESIHFN